MITSPALRTADLRDAVCCLLLIRFGNTGGNGAGCFGDVAASLPLIASHLSLVL